MSSDTEMSDISEISSSPEDDETGEGEEEDVEVIYSQIRPYQENEWIEEEMEWEATKTFRVFSNNDRATIRPWNETETLAKQKQNDVVKVWYS